MLSEWTRSEELRRRYFIGREREKTLFRSLLESKTLEYNILVVHGMGGVGKSTLLSEFKAMCLHRKIPAAIVNGDEHNEVLSLLTSLRTQLTPLKGIRSPFHSFDKAIVRLHDLQAKLIEQRHLSEKPGLPSKIASEVVKETTQTALTTGIGGVIGTLVGGPLGTAIGIGVGVTTGLALEGIESSVTQLMRRGLTREDAELIIDRERILSERFAIGVNKLADKNRVVLMIDAYEYLDNLDDWVRDGLIERLDGQRVIVVIAGRNRPESGKWQAWAPVLKQIELQPFRLEETAAYLEQRAASLRSQAFYIHKKTKGLPLGVALWADLGTGAIITASVTPTEQIDQEATVVSQVIERLLSQIPRDTQQAVRVAAVPRWFNQELLSELLDGRNTLELFDQLQRLTSLTRIRAVGLSLHDEVRAYLLRDFRRREPDRLRQLHLKAANYYANACSKAEHAMGKFSEEWKQLIIEHLYHIMMIGNGLDLFIRLFEEADNLYQLDFCGALLDEVKAYSRENKALDRWIQYAEGHWYSRCNKWREAKEKFENLIHLNDLQPTLRTRVLEDLGRMYERFGELEKAIGFYNKSLTIQRSVGNPTGISRALSKVGKVYTFQGKLAKAIRCFRESYRIAQANGDITEARKALFGMELAYIYRGDWKRAEKCFMEALVVGDQRQKGAPDIQESLIVNYEETVTALFDLSLGCILSGKLEDAQHYLELIRERAVKVGDQWRLGLAIYNLGEIFRLQREWEKALKHFNESIKLLRSAGASLSIGIVLKSWGITLHRVGRLAEARECLERSLMIARQARSQYEVGRILYNLGNLYLDLGDWEKAYDCYIESREIAKRFEGRWLKLLRVYAGLLFQEEIGRGCHCM